MIARARRIAGLDHPALVPTKFVCLGRSPKVVTDFFSTSVKAVLAAPPDWWMANAKAITVVGIATATEYVHSQAVTDKDLRPANVFFDEHRRPHVAGLVSFATTSYAAPDSDHNEKADVFAFGLILYEIVVGGSHLGSRAVPKDVKMEVKTFIKTCTAPKPTDRPRFARIMRDLRALDYGIVPGIDKAEVSKYVSSLGPMAASGLLTSRAAGLFSTRLWKPPNDASAVIPEPPPTELDLSFTDAWQEAESESESESSDEFASRIPQPLSIVK